MPSSLTWVALLLAVASLAALVGAILALRRRRLLGMTVGLLFSALLLSWAALFGLISVAITGYDAFTREDLVATIDTQPQGPGRFIAHFHFVDGSDAVYQLAGNQLYVDARILKWKSIANFFGLHTQYKLDRVAGRWRDLHDEQTQPHTVFALHPASDSVDMFDLRTRYAVFEPLLDAQYGSASFASADQPRRYQLFVSTTGLLLRDAPVTTRAHHR